ncbi:hypothetical protein BCV70DRAFT_41473 [Testicularia cyperi]|uniref:Uncharacterized protein n=1 Tax=Testicularia cyperi TaxID=1882483 RepID=A0A317XIP2_9BASI|nr:hypothetical protein BCV70DRAFT_41473 [Testicularia cyperi]
MLLGSVGRHYTRPQYWQPGTLHPATSSAVSLSFSTERRAYSGCACAARSPHLSLGRSAVLGITTSVMVTASLPLSLWQFSRLTPTSGAGLGPAALQW